MYSVYISNTCENIPSGNAFGLPCGLAHETRHRKTIERKFAEVELVAMLSAVMGLLGRVGLAKRGVPWNPWNHG